MQFDFINGEVLLIDKPYGWTSFDVVNKIRVSLKQTLAIKKIKVGHAGTLDPLATGLLIICTGKFTKRINEFMGMEKEYTGTFHLGQTTPSYDLETEVDQNFSVEHISPEMVNETAAHFTGEIEQVPPLYSAIKLKGNRAYTHARNKEDITLSPRKVNIKTFEITHYNLPEVGFRVVCSKGTYIRALARDLGNSLGCGAYLSSLIRTRIGTFLLKDALTTEQFTAVMKS